MRLSGRTGLVLLCLATGASATSTPLEFGAPSRLECPPGPSIPLVADVTGDGRADVVVYSAADRSLRTFVARGDGTFDAPVVTPLPDVVGVEHLRAARMDSDAASDLVMLRHAGESFDAFSSLLVDVFLSDGKGGFVRSAELTARDAPGAYFVRDGVPCDWDGDGKIDVLTTTREGDLRAYLNDGAGRFPVAQTLVNVATSRRLAGENGEFVVADLDGDGRPDFVAPDPDGPAFGLHVNWRLADGALAQGTTLETGPYAASALGALAEDFDGDGLRDLAVLAAYGDGKFSVTVFLHSASRTFAPGATWYPPDAGKNYAVAELAAADFDGDGRLDIVTPSGILMNDGAGGFPTSIPLPAVALRPAAVDLDGDGRPDVVIPDPAGGFVVTSVRAAVRSPYVASIDPPTIPFGTSLDVVLRGSGFDAGAKVDFGPGTFAIVLPGTTDAELHVQLFADTAFSPGARLASVANPDGAVGRAPFTFDDPVVPSLAVHRVERVAPDFARPGDSLDVVVRGKGVGGAVDVSFGAGVTVNSASPIDDDAFVVHVTVAGAATPGPRDVRVVHDFSGQALETVASGLFEIAPAHSLDVTTTTGRLVAGARPLRGAFSASGAFSFNSFSPDRTFDPAAETARLRFGDPDAPVAIDIAAGSWRVRRGRATWTSARGAKPSARVVLDFARRTFRIDVARADVTASPSGDVLVELSLGDETGSSLRRWTAGRGGRLSLHPDARRR